MKVVDVSNYVPADLSALIAQEHPDAIIVRCKLRAEWRIKDGIDAAQIQSAQAHGLAAGLYVWCYGSSDPGDTVQQAISLAQANGIALNGVHPAAGVLWLDCEDPNDPPNIGWVKSALQWAKNLQVSAGIYTSRGWWAAHIHGDERPFVDIPLWLADYNGDASLDGQLPPAWDFMVGHQYQENPDLSIFIDAPQNAQEPADGPQEEEAVQSLIESLNLIWDRADRAQKSARGETSESVESLMEELKQLGVVEAKKAIGIQ